MSKPITWTTEQRVVKDLVPYEYNPRILTEGRKQKLKESLEKFNLAEIPAINTDNIIIAGHQRIKALMELGRADEVIDVRMPSRKLTKAEFKEYNIVSNVPVGIWDVDVLEEFFTDIDLDALGLDVDNIELPELDLPEDLSPKEDDYEIPEEIKTNIKLGDLIEIGPHRLLCGDSTKKEDVELLMNGEKADMVFTDPPYNVAFNGRSGKFDVIENDDLPEKEFENLIDGFVSVLEILKPEHYYVWCNWKFYGLLQSKLDFKACIVWEKNVFGLGRGYRHQHEFCLFNGKLDEGRNSESDLWEIAKDSKYMHPTQKPIALSVKALGNHKKAKNIVDLFGGSGSTLLGVHQSKRKGFVMELDPKYCQVIIDRMLNYDNALKVKVKVNGKTYTPIV